MSGGAFACDCFRMRDDFVFDALEVLEKQRVVAGRCVIRIFARRRDDYSPNDLQLSVKSIDFGPGPRSEGKMVECPWFSSMNCFIPEARSRRRDGEGHPRMAVLNNVEFMRIYDRARFAFGAEAEKRKELVVEGNGDRHIANRYLNMIDYRLHSPSSSFAKDENMKNSGASQGQSASELISKRIAELGDWRGETLGRMRKLIKEADPEVVEEWKWMGTPVWWHDGIICTGESYKKVVKLTFAKGASLKDPARLFNSSLDGNVRRAIDLHEGEEVDESAFKALVRQAIALNKAKKSRRA